jgi:predicted AlkP superfamily pyrophosphatase or phosphodiesterase
MKKTVVLNIVGLTRSLIGPHTPRLRDYLLRSSSATIGHVSPAVTCSVQSTYLTGKWPSEHGIVGNGWYDRTDCEIKFWKQSNKLVQGLKIWDAAKAIDPTFTCANLFWWYNMYSSVDVSVTPRPMYLADGRKLPDIYTQPPELRESLQKELGQFPLFNFWGPTAGIRSSEWIAESAVRVDEKFNPTLTLIYLPHLDYVLQREGPNGKTVTKELAAIDAVAGRLIDFYESRAAAVIVLSEYGIAKVDQPVHLNRVLRRAGLLSVRTELDRELLDAGASTAFAVADHQIAHVYVNDSSQIGNVRGLLEDTPGVAEVLDHAAQASHGLDHARSGDLVVIAKPNAWFTYYYWLDDARMPDFARTVDIHRKPGYDPVELFVDPKLTAVKLRIAGKLLKKKLGFRYLMDVIPTDATLVRGSHGLPPASPDEGPIVMTRQNNLLSTPPIESTAVFDLILAHLQRQ